jgi:hypothetical protein
MMLQTQFFPVFPDPGGLLSVGADINGNTLFWLTKGEPDEWPVVYMDDDFLEYDLYEMSLTTFLVEWISGRIEPRALQGLCIRESGAPIYLSDTPKQLGLCPGPATLDNRQEGDLSPAE